MLGVKLLAHGGDTAAGYRLLTAGAERAASLVIMRLAVRLTLVLEETAIHEGNETFLQTDRQNKTSVLRRENTSESDATHHALSHIIQTLHTKHSGCHRELRAEM